MHEGHLTLIRSAKRVQGAVVVVSIFVNPLQFGANEDLDAYPRTLDDDLAALREERVEIAFTPTAADMYPDGMRTSVHPGPLGSELEGAARPTHFAGVLTVVLKLLNIVGPDRAFFGEKDYQQLTLIRQMVADLGVGTQVVGVPIVREPDGLAMSSRNRYLNEVEREQAGALSAALLAGMYARPERVRRRRWMRPALCSTRCRPSTWTTWRFATRCWGRRPPWVWPACWSPAGSDEPDSWTTSPSTSDCHLVQVRISSTTNTNYLGGTECCERC